MLRCTDPGCVEPPDIVILGSVGSVVTHDGEVFWPAGLDMALRPDGSPIVIVEHPDRAFATIYACTDPACATVQIADFGDEDSCSESDGNPCPRLDFAQIAIAPDGMPRIVYFSRGAAGLPRLMFAICGDPLCELDSRSTVTIDDDIGGFARPSIRIESDGQVLIGYYTDMEDGDGLSQARIAVCMDGSCSPGPTILTFDDAVEPRTTASDNGEFLAWYRSGPLNLFEGKLDVPAILENWEIRVAVCNRTSCGEARRVEAGWELLMSWTRDPRLLRTPDGTVAVAFRYWSPDQCAALLELATLDPQRGMVGTELGTYVYAGSSFDSVMRNGALLVVFGGEGGGLHLVEMPLTEPSPIDADSPLSDRCATS